MKLYVVQKPWPEPREPTARATLYEVYYVTVLTFLVTLVMNKLTNNAVDDLIIRMNPMSNVNHSLMYYASFFITYF